MNKTLLVFSRCFVVLLLLCLATESMAQYRVSMDSIPMRYAYTKGKFKTAIAYYQIESLKNGVLLVRLQTKQKAIDHFLSIRNSRAAERIKDEQELMNADIIAAFKESYDFTNVYFFSSEYSDLVRAHKLDSIPYLDKHIVDRSIKDLKDTSFLIAELTTLEADTGTARVNEYQYEKRKKTGASVNSNMGISALVFKSDQFVQLDRPFPYYVRGYTSFLQELLGIKQDIRKLPKIVAKANADLKYFAAGKDWRTVVRKGYALPTLEENGKIEKSDGDKGGDD